MKESHRAGGLDFEEFKSGIKTFPGAANVNLTLDDFEVITDAGALLGPGLSVEKLSVLLCRKHLCPTPLSYISLDGSCV